MDSILGLTPARGLTDALHSEFFERYRDEATAVRIEIEHLVEEAAITQKQEPLQRGTARVNTWNTRRGDARAVCRRPAPAHGPEPDQVVARSNGNCRKDQIGDGRIAGERRPDPAGRRTSRAGRKTGTGRRA